MAFNQITKKKILGSIIQNGEKIYVDSGYGNYALEKT